MWGRLDALWRLYLASIVRTTLIGTVVTVVLFLFRYQSSVRRRLRSLRNSSFFGKGDPFRMIRTTIGDAGASPVAKQLQLLSLDPQFVAKYPDWSLMSLGDYLSSLRPMLTQNEELPDWIESELQNALAAALLANLGPQFGAAVLPGLGVTGSTIERVAALLASKVAQATNISQSTSDDRGTVPLSLFAITYAAEVNYRRQKNHARPLSSPSDHLQRGEVGFDLSFADLVPNPFDFSDWTRTIRNMEEQLMMRSSDKQSGTEGGIKVAEYVPHSRELEPPRPIDQRLLPDLHTGCGSALCTHSKREILQNRLLSVILNRLASNYVNLNKFIVRMNGQDISKPDDFVKGLIVAGHSVEACIRTHPTTFGVALCIKEKGDNWTNIPLAFFLSSGHVDRDGNEAAICIPHSGLNLEIREGPTIQHASVQHFMGIEGMCGWQSNHVPDVPWIRDQDCGGVMKQYDTLVSVRVAAMEAVVLNEVGTENNLPLGGYGLSGVCNDSAALIEHAVFKKTSVYPLSFNGKFAMSNWRMGKRIRATLEQDNDIEAMDALLEAIEKLPSDTNSLPCELSDQFARMENCISDEMPFSLMARTRQIIREIRDEFLDNSIRSRN